VDLDPVAVEEALRFATGNLAASVRIYRHGCLVARSGWDPTNEWSPMAT